MKYIPETREELENLLQKGIHCEKIDVSLLDFVNTSIASFDMYNSNVEVQKLRVKFKYVPQTRAELDALIRNLDIALSDITPYCVNDLSFLFLDTERTDFTGLEDWDVSQVTNMAAMFSSCCSFNADLSNWQVSKVIDMSSMFEGCCDFNSDLSKWNVSNVIDMAFMFEDCNSFNSDISNWNVSNVTNMSGMFRNCRSFKCNLSKWDLSGLKGTKYLPKILKACLKTKLNETNKVKQISKTILKKSQKNNLLKDYKVCYKYVKNRFYENETISDELNNNSKIRLTNDINCNLTLKGCLALNNKILNINKYSIENILIYNYLIDNNIRYCYHFSRMENFENISKYGLCSRKYLEFLKVKHRNGGNELSQHLDQRNSLDQKVHLSFCRSTPMLFRLYQQAPLNRYIMFIIPIGIVLFNNTLFTSENASANSAVPFCDLEKFKEEFSEDNLKTIRKINKGKIKYIYSEDDEFKLKQSEILVDRVPVWYLENFNFAFCKKYENSEVTFEDLSEKKINSRLDGYFFHNYWHGFLI